MTKEVKTTRNLKVIEQSGYRYQATPTVMLKAKWLSEFGFDIGTHVKVECEDGRNIARYMRVDKLIRPFKDRLDASDLTLTAAVELSYLSEDEQEAVTAQDVKVDEKTAKAVRAAAGELTEGKLEEILHPAKAPAQAKVVIVKLPAKAEEKYFSGLKAKDWADLVMQALVAWFAGKEAADV